MFAFVRAASIQLHFYSVLYLDLAHFLFGWRGWMDQVILGWSDSLIGFVNLYIINQSPNPSLKPTILANGHLGAVASGRAPF